MRGRAPDGKRIAKEKRPALSPIRPETLSERLIPQRPGWLRALIVTVTLLAAAIAARLLVLPEQNAVYPGSPMFPRRAKRWRKGSSPWRG